MFTEDDCSLRYFAEFESFDFRNVVDFEPFEWKDSESESYGGNHYVVASRMMLSRGSPFPCTRSIIYRWSRKRGWHAYDYLGERREVCNARFSKYFVVNDVPHLAVLDLGQSPEKNKSTILIYRLQRRCRGAKFCGQTLVQRLTVYAYKFFGEQFDIFSIGDTTFLAAANFRTPRGCRHSSDEASFWCFQPNTNSVIYRWDPRKNCFRRV